MNKYCFFGKIVLHSSINEIDQGIGGRVVGSSCASFLNFRLDLLCKLLAKLDSPLVVGVNVPDDTLDEDFVLVCGDQLAQREGIEFREKNRVCWSITLDKRVIIEK